jgi:hypothetical protein
MKAILLLLLAGPASSEPTLEEIVTRHVEALGGEEALRSIETLRKTGTYVYNGIEHPLRSFHKLGRRSREEIDGLQIWGTGRREGHVVLRGTNGAVAWNLDASRAAEWSAIPPFRAAILREDSDLTGALFDAAKKGHRVELLEPGDVEGKPAHRLRVTLASGFEQIWFLDVETFLVLRKEMTGEERERIRTAARLVLRRLRKVNGSSSPSGAEEPIRPRVFFETIEANVPSRTALRSSGASVSSR